MAGMSLRLESIYRRYGKVTAVNDLSLELPAGKFITLLGPSGCGKTTTLNLIAGLDQADGGSIHMGERDITRVPPNERGMAIVFQNYALYPHMSVFDNIAFGLRLQRRPKPEIQSRVRHTAELLAIEHLLDRRPGQLSGGQQQRVALGRAMVKKPAVFLLDEPFSNLDAALRARMRTEVKHLHQTLGTTSVFVTHDQEEAMTLSDLIAVMRDGKLVQYGTQHEVYGRPRDMYVATFLGKPRMSLIEEAWNGTPPESCSRRRTSASNSAPPRPSGCATASGRGSRPACGPRTCRWAHRAGCPSTRRSPCWSRSGRTRSWNSRSAERRSSPGCHPRTRSHWATASPR